MEIYCDCSFDEKNKVAGIGLLVKEGARQNAISHWIKAPDNNFGEIWAVYQAAILMGGKDGTIYTDSQTTIAYINNLIKDKPRTIEAYERHQRMRLMAYKIRKLNARVKWVKGHNKQMKEDSLSNNIADILAKMGINKYLQNKQR